LINSSNTVLDAKDFYPLGLEMPARGYVSGIGAKEGFTSKERDGETGTDYFGARYYMSAIGRWGNMDPLAEQYPASTPYIYVLNNPVNAVPDRIDGNLGLLTRVYRGSVSADQGHGCQRLV
jgi:RHS repeat-associated protein